MKPLPIILVFLVGATSAAQERTRKSIQDRIIAAAERYLGEPYVFGGRDGRAGCRRDGKRVRCPEGIDCQSLIFFAYEKALKTRWTGYSVMPSVCVRRNQLGRPVLGLDGVLRAELDKGKLKKGDVLFFLWKNYNLDADRPLWSKGDDRYGVWHTGLVHGLKNNQARVIHAKPGEKVVIEPLDDVEFDALFVVRLPRGTRTP
jgi:cell wall-associated NlpC family hydrolase